MSLNYFDAIAYINLKHRTDRDTRILKELARLKADKSKITRFEGNYTPFNGHIGCVLSHIDVINWAIEKNLNNILVLEDDCYFIDDVNFLNATIEYFLKIVTKWHVFLLGGYFEEVEKNKYPYINRIKKSYRSHSYAINGCYFKKLRENFYESFNLLKKYSAHFHQKGEALDSHWHILQKKDLWYSSNILLTAQIEGYSDIFWKDKPTR